MRIYQNIVGSKRNIIGFDKEEYKVSTLTGYPTKLFDNLEKGSYHMISINERNTRVSLYDNNRTLVYSSGWNDKTIMNYIGDANNTEELMKLIPQEFV